MDTFGYAIHFMKERVLMDIAALRISAVSMANDAIALMERDAKAKRHRSRRIRRAKDLAAQATAILTSLR